MTRDDLFNINAGIVKNLVTAAAKHCPEVRMTIMQKQSAPILQLKPHALGSGMECVGGVDGRVSSSDRHPPYCLEGTDVVLGCRATEAQLRVSCPSAALKCISVCSIDAVCSVTFSTFIIMQQS